MCRSPPLSPADEPSRQMQAEIGRKGQENTLCVGLQVVLSGRDPATRQQCGAGRRPRRYLRAPVFRLFAARRGPRATPTPRGGAHLAPNIVDTPWIKSHHSVST